MSTNNQNKKDIVALKHRIQRAKKKFTTIQKKHTELNFMDNQTVIRRSIFNQAKLKLSHIMNWQGLSFLCFVFNFAFFCIWTFDERKMLIKKERLPTIAIVDYVELLDHFYETLPAKEIEFNLLYVQARLDSLIAQGIIVLDASLIHGAPREYYLPIHWLVQSYPE